jgi:hypothetical protein
MIQFPNKKNPKLCSDFLALAADYLGFSSSAWVPEAGACLIQELLPSWGIQKVQLVGVLWWANSPWKHRFRLAAVSWGNLGTKMGIWL